MKANVIRYTIGFDTFSIFCLSLTIADPSYCGPSPDVDIDKCIGLLSIVERNQSTLG